MGEVIRDSSSIPVTKENHCGEFNVLIKVYNDWHTYRSSVRKEMQLTGSGD